MWFIPYVSTYGVSFNPLFVGYISLKNFDSGWSELFGGQGLFWFFISLSKVNQ
jgi:NADH-ubiquinone oxidoreductase chain 5